MHAPSWTRTVAKWFGIVAAVLGVVGYIQDHFHYEKIAELLSLPSQLPNSVFFIQLLVSAGIIIYLSSTSTARADAAAHQKFELRTIREQLDAKQAELDNALQATDEAVARVAIAEKKSATLENRDEAVKALRNRIVGILTLESQNEDQILQRLSHHGDVPFAPLVQEVLGQMCLEKAIRHNYLGKYELC